MARFKDAWRYFSCDAASTLIKLQCTGCPLWVKATVVSRYVDLRLSRGSLMGILLLGDQNNGELWVQSAEKWVGINEITVKTNKDHNSPDLECDRA